MRKRCVSTYAVVRCVGGWQVYVTFVYCVETAMECE